jgi:hypothetical protein
VVVDLEASTAVFSTISVSSSEEMRWRLRFLQSGILGYGRGSHYIELRQC